MFKFRSGMVLSMLVFCLAASLPNKSNAQGPTAASHAGSYVGAHLGLAWIETENTDLDGYSTPVPGTTIDFSDRTRAAGFLIGHNRQFNNLVIGLEGDITFGDFSAFTFDSDPDERDETAETIYNRIATIRGRLGYSIGRVLVFGTGGIAIADITNKLSDFDAVPPVFDPDDSFTDTETRTGWVAGGGIDLISQTGNWSGRVEALYMDFGDVTNKVDTIPGGTNSRFRSENLVKVVRFAITRKIGN